MSITEQRYAQIEKEASGITWASKRLADYLIGLEFHIETDHKPLVPLLSIRNFEDLPARVQRFRIRMMRFTYSISHVPGKSPYTADTLSRAPLVRPLSRKKEMLEADVQAYVDSIVKYLPATEDRLEDFRTQQQQNEITRQLITYRSEVWPETSQLPGPLKVYWPERSDLTVQQGLLMKGNRLVVPLTMRIDILEKLHQGITKCREGAKASVWWPGLSHQLEEVVKQCPTCIKERVNPAEPVIRPSYPIDPGRKSQRTYSN